MAKKKGLSRAERYAQIAKMRAPIIAVIDELEEKYGESAVNGAFARRTQIRRERRRLQRAQQEINAKIAKLSA